MPKPAIGCAGCWGFGSRSHSPAAFGNYPLTGSSLNTRFVVKVVAAVAHGDAPLRMPCGRFR